MLDTLLFEQSQVASIAVYHHSLLFFEQFIQSLTTLTTLLDDFHVHVIRNRQGCTYSSLSATHDNHILHIGVMLLSHNLADIRDILLRGHEINQVIGTQFIHTTWDDGIVFTLDGYNVIRIIRTTEFTERTVQDLCCFTQFDTK